MLVDDFLEVKRCSCIIWYKEEDIRKYPIGRTILQVDDDRSDCIHDFLGVHGRITAHNRRGCGGSGSINRR